MNLPKIAASLFLFVVFSVVCIFAALVIEVYHPGHGELAGFLAIGGPVIIAVALIVGAISDAAKNRQQAAERLNQVIASTRAYIETLERSRTFVAVDVPGLHLEQGEFTVQHERAKLAEFRSARVGGGVGTRVRVGGFPIYLGGWKSAPMNELRAVGFGDLVITNRRLLFLGANTLSIPFDHLLTCEQISPGLVISESRHKSPHVFYVENEGLWCFLVNWLADNRFENPKLPDRVHLSVAGKAPKLRVEVHEVPPLPKVENSTA